MFWSKEPTLLELEIDRAVASLKNHAVYSEEYEKTLGHISTLHAMKTVQKPSRRMSTDTMATVSANLLGILMILKYEAGDQIIRSKALSFVLKPRI